MARRLFTLAAAVSFVSCGAAGALWVRSLRQLEQVRLAYVRWPQPDEYQALHVGISLYGNTRRLEVVRVARLPAFYRNLMRGRSAEWSAEWLKGTARRTRRGCVGRSRGTTSRRG